MITLDRISFGGKEFLPDSLVVGEGRGRVNFYSKETGRAFKLESPNVSIDAEFSVTESYEPRDRDSILIALNSLLEEKGYCLQNINFFRVGTLGRVEGDLYYCEQKKK